MPYATSPAELVGQYLIQQLHRRHAHGWLSSPRPPKPIDAKAVEPLWLEQIEISLLPKQRQKLVYAHNIRELFQQFYFRSVVLDSHEGMVAWLEGRYPLDLRHDFPTPLEMLEAQCEGRRIVTWLRDPEVQTQPHGRHMDACAFTLHDLEHAHKFFADRPCHIGQVKFFRLLKSELPYLEHLRSDPQFSKDLDYLMSDMNSHPVHLTKFLKAIVLSAEIGRTGDAHPKLQDFFNELFSRWNMTSTVLESALKINQPGLESTQDQITLEQFFMSSETTCTPSKADYR